LQFGFSLEVWLFRPSRSSPICSSLNHSPGLFGAAPSVALASVVLTVCTKGKGIAITEARSMILGAIALLVYAAFVSRILLHFRVQASRITLGGLLLWLGAAIGLWYFALGS
jgi:hypothetical protein